MGGEGDTTNLSAPPVILNVFPEPVCPYVNIVLLKSTLRSEEEVISTYGRTRESIQVSINQHLFNVYY